MLTTRRTTYRGQSIGVGLGSYPIGAQRVWSPQVQAPAEGPAMDPQTQVLTERLMRLEELLQARLTQPRSDTYQPMPPGQSQPPPQPRPQGPTGSVTPIIERNPDGSLKEPAGWGTDPGFNDQSRMPQPKTPFTGDPGFTQPPVGLPINWITDPARHGQANVDAFRGAVYVGVSQNGSPMARLGDGSVVEIAPEVFEDSPYRDWSITSLGPARQQPQNGAPTGSVNPAEVVAAPPTGQVAPPEVAAQPQRSAVPMPVPQPQPRPPQPPAPQPQPVVAPAPAPAPAPTPNPATMVWSPVYGWTTIQQMMSQPAAPVPPVASPAPPTATPTAGNEAGQSGVTGAAPPLPPGFDQPQPTAFEYAPPPPPEQRPYDPNADILA